MVGWASTEAPTPLVSPCATLRITRAHTRCALTARLDKAKKKLAQQERALERSYTHMGDLEKSAKQMEELNEQEAVRVKQTDKEIGVLKDRMFHEGQKLFELRQQEATFLAEISGAQRVSRNARCVGGDSRVSSCAHECTRGPLVDCAAWPRPPTPSVSLAGLSVVPSNGCFTLLLTLALSPPSLPLVLSVRR